MSDPNYPLPCAQCGRRMLRSETTAIYPRDGMICVDCAKNWEDTHG